MADTAARAFDQELSASSPWMRSSIEYLMLLALADTLASELRRPGPASNLLVEYLVSRKPSVCTRSGPIIGATGRRRNDTGFGGLTPSQRRRAIDFIETNLCENFRVA